MKGYSRRLRTWPIYGTASGVQWDHQEQGSDQDDPQRITDDAEAAQRITTEANRPGRHALPGVEPGACRD